MSGELIWFVLPVSGIIYMAGGTWKKQFKRIGVPLSALVVTCLFAGIHWAWIVMALWYFGKMTIPLTLIGDGIPDHWFNWIWVWVHGYLMGLPCLIFGVFTEQVLAAFLLSFVPCVLHGLFTTFSNLRFSRAWFPHKLCEFVTGASVLYPLARLVEVASL